MMKQQQQQQQQNMILQRSASTSTTTRKNNKNNNNRRSTSNIPSNFQPSESNDDYSQNFLIKRGLSLSPSFSSNQHNNTNNNQTTTKKLSSLIRSFLNIFTFQTIIPTCNWLTLPTTLSPKNFPPTSRKLTGTLFGHRRGHISFAVQLHPRASPLLLLELSMSTSSLVKEMSSGLVRIALECRKPPVATSGHRRRLFNEPDWTMYCNGRKCGYAVTRTCGDLDWHVLSTVQSVSVGAGVIPVLQDGKGGGGSEGELMYMRARFERVVGSRDSEAFYMLNPDGNGGPELSIFLLRL